MPLRTPLISYTRGIALQTARASGRPSAGGEPSPRGGNGGYKGLQSKVLSWLTLSLREPSPSLPPEREQRTHPTADMKRGAARQGSNHMDTVLGNARLTLKMLKMLVDFLNMSDFTKSSSCARVSSRWVMAQIPKQQARPWGGAQVCSAQVCLPQVCSPQVCSHSGIVTHLPTCCVGRNEHPSTCTQSTTHTEYMQAYVQKQAVCHTYKHVCSQYTWLAA